MKRLLLLIGLGLIIWGVLGLNELKRQKSAIPEVKPGYGIPEKDRENLSKDNTIAIAMIVVGGILFLWGLTPTMKRKQTAPGPAIASPAPTSASVVPPAIPVSVDPDETSADTITQLERLAKLKVQGLLTEEEFQKEKAKILG